LADSHTYIAGGVNLVVTVVLVSHGELFELLCDVIGSARVGVLVGVDGVGVGVCRNINRALLRCAMEGGVEALVTPKGNPPLFSISRCGLHHSVGSG
jgi:hypothetical protein